ncbi:MAG TPA: SDR family NAD(P)-dependent oxidoreductase [Rhizomicrobium sp.]|jgi:NAD(P)-dependent dehydrogenase (short-subunit alcohol dehydrogenase family)|nr:SDR family NAD(P)-dependent oxidoreductase [Rhizomicrobium sp.]
MKDFRGKTVFVTGGASGIGFALARAFGREGAQIALADIDFDAARQAADRLHHEQIKATAICCDVSQRHALEHAALETVAAYGKVHIVCNNAGVAVGGPLGTIGASDWDWIIDVNLKSVVCGTEIFYPLIRSHGEGGHFINTASMAGLISPPGLEPYSATKFAVVAMSEGWAQQLQPLNIGVSVLCPGYVRTRIHESGRARPERYGGSGEVDAGVGATRQEAAENVMHGIDPDIVGARVIECVRAGELFIFTHPMMRDFVEARFQFIRAGFDSADRSPALKNVKEWAPVRAATPQPPK